jgi:S-DNA-T family DNA segregation ATPase FtsK/SpoIIIE
MAASTAKKKRRGEGSRQRAKRKNAPVKTTAKKKKKNTAKQTTFLEREWVLEILAVLSATSGILLLLCTLGLKLRVLYPETPLFNAGLLGPLGKLVGTMSVGFFGWIALLPAVGLLTIALHLWRVTKGEIELGFELKSRSLFVIGLIGSILSACMLAEVVLGRGAGGLVGENLGAPVQHLLNTTGASIVAGAIFLLSFAFATQSNTADVLSILYSALRRGIILLFWHVPRIALFLTYDICVLSYIVCFTALSKVARALKAVFTGIASRSVAEEDLFEEELPKPRRRSNRVPEPEELELEEEGELFTHVVVSRRKQSAKATSKLLSKARRKQQEQIEEFVQVGFPPYDPPNVSLLTPGEPTISGEDDETLRKKSRVIESKLKDFGISGRVTFVHPGPVITLFEFEPAAGVKVGKIAGLQDDLAMSLRASSIRIIAPIPGRGTVGIEVPNSHRDVVQLRDCLESELFITANSSLSIAIGKDTYGDPLISDIASMPHLLVAGATGTGKSVFINSILMSLLYRASPAELGLILIDPKILELSVYDEIPHLRVPVVTDPRQAKAVLEWAVKEMDRRYRLMHKYGVRSVDGYNDIARGESPSEESVVPDDVVPLTDDDVIAEGTAAKQDEMEELADKFKGAEIMQPLPKIVIVIDELADLMLTVGRDIEDLITRLAQKARAAGIHLIVATQRPSVDVITGLIKANFPARISFRVTSKIDSRTILDGMGAERLLGKGDMLFMRPGAQHVKRVHGAFISDADVNRVVTQVKKQATPQYDPAIIAACEKALEEESVAGGGDSEFDEYDALYDKAVELVVDKGKASTSMVQRAFRIGYNRAARIIEMMEREGVIGPMDGAKPRQVLVGAIGGEDAGVEP